MLGRQYAKSNGAVEEPASHSRLPFEIASIFAYDRLVRSGQG